MEDACFSRSIELKRNNTNSMQLLHLLYAGMKEEIRLIRVAQQQEDYANLCLLFHKMRGGLYYVSIPSLQKALLELHAAVKTKKQIAELTPVFDKFYCEYDMFVQDYDGMKDLPVVQQKLEMATS